MQKIGRYIIEGTLGQGGMGMVYRARDPIIGRAVAIKVIQDRALSPATKDRFYKEARSAGRLSHENITTLHDVSEEEGTPYLVMELLGGNDLRHVLLKGTPLPLGEKLDVALQICRGLYYAHNHHVIHRDIKPENIRVLEEGRVKIMDFGLARIETDTLTHTSMGTPRYMSPEQVKGAHVDHRTDIFSFGVLFYELLTGTNPFSGEHVTSIIYKILHEHPEPIQIEDGPLGEELQGIVSRCIEKEADQRYDDFGAVIQDLKDAAAAQQRTRTLPRMAAWADRKEAAPGANASRGKQTASSSAWRMALGVLLFASVVGGGYLVFQSAPARTPHDEARLASGMPPAVEPSAPSHEAGANAGAEPRAGADASDEAPADTPAEAPVEVPLPAVQPQNGRVVGPAVEQQASQTDANAREQIETPVPEKAVPEKAVPEKAVPEKAVPEETKRPSEPEATGPEATVDRAEAEGLFETLAGLRVPEEKEAPAQPPEPENLVRAVQGEASVLQGALEEAILGGDWSSVPAPLTTFYKKKVDKLRKTFDIVDVSAVPGDAAPESGGTRAALPVSLYLSYVQKGRGREDAVRLPATWIWERADGPLKLVRVQ